METRVRTRWTSVLAEMKKHLSSLGIGIAVCSLVGIAGCELESYSESVRFALREDPLIRVGSKIGDERWEPDYPGQLPIKSMAEINDPNHPFYPKRSTLNDEIIRDPMQISAAERQELLKALDEIFGVPAHPRIAEAAAGEGKTITAELRKKLRLEDANLEKGSKSFRTHCMHCHGKEGDGRGPTAKWVNPHPRDFRQSLFKFSSVDRSVDASRLPLREDLIRTINHGLEGTAMPAFSLLPRNEIEDLVSYVIFLSIRGAVEYNVMVQAYTADAKTGKLTFAKDEDRPNVSASVKAYTQLFVNNWATSQDPSVKIKVGPYPIKEGDTEALKKSVQRGQALFLGDEKAAGKIAGAAKCVTCHADYGRQSKFRFDDWATLAKPNNFTNGVFRGGRRPVDLYYRIHSGIAGSGMNVFGKELSNDDIWNLVNFVQVLNSPTMQKSLEIKLN